MHNLQRAESVADEARAKAPPADDADRCIARLDPEHAPRPCPRGSSCHCARPIGHPVPVEVQGARTGRR